MFEAWGSLPLAGVVLAACLVAFVRGGPVERRGAAVYTLALLAVTATRLAVPAPAKAAQLGLDGALFVALFVLSWKSARVWPIWTAMLQAVAVGVDLAAITRPELSAHVRASALWMVGLAQASAFGWGTIPAITCVYSINSTLNIVVSTLWYRFPHRCWGSCIPRSGRRSTRWRRV